MLWNEQTLFTIRDIARTIEIERKEVSMAESTVKQIEPDGVRLGEAIRKAREALGLSLRQLAPLVQLHHSFLARLKAGDYQTAKPAVLQRLSRVLELDERDLFALAGLDAPEGLPAFTPYLRAKYDMSDEAAQALHEYFSFVSRKYEVKEKRQPSSDDGDPIAA